MISFDLPIAAVQAGAVLALLFVVPGLTLGRVLAPGSMPPLARLGRAAAVSLLTTSAACTLLALIGALRPTIVLAALAGLVVLPLQASPPGRLRLPRGQRRRGWLIALASVVAISVVAALPTVTATVGSAAAFTATSWHHALVADRLAGGAGLAPVLPMWGVERAILSDHLPFSAHAAAAFQLLPGDLPVRMESYRWAVLGSVGAAAVLLFQRFVSSWLAALATALLLAAERVTAGLLEFGPHGVGLVLALFALWLLDRAVVERTRGLAGLAVGVIAVTVLTDREAALALVPAAIGVMVARLLVAPFAGRRAPHGMREAIGVRIPQPRRLASIAGIALLVVGGGLGIGLLGRATIGGGLPVLGTPGGDADAAVAPGEVTIPELPHGWSLTGDGAWDLHVAAVAPGEVGREPPRTLADPRLAGSGYLAVWPGVDERRPEIIVTLGGLVAAPLLAWPWLDGRRRRLVAATIGAALGLLALAVLLDRLGGGYAVHWIASQLASFAMVGAAVVAGLVALWGVDRLLRPGIRALVPWPGEGDPLGPNHGARSGPRPAAMLAAGAMGALFTAGIIAPAPAASLVASDVRDSRRLTAAGLEAWRWIAAETPPGSRVLANAHTEGVAALIGRRTAILEGGAILRMDRRSLAEATMLVLGARALFSMPETEAADRYLERERVDYLLVADVTAGATAGDLGGDIPFAADIAALERRYAMVRTFGDGVLRLYAAVTSVDG